MPELKSYTDHEQERRSYWNEITLKTKDGPIPSGVECPDCSGELCDPDPSLITIAYPPRMMCKCDKCGWEGPRIY